MKARKSRRHDRVQHSNDDHDDRGPRPTMGVLNMDVICTMQDDELIGQLDAMYEARNEAHERYRPTQHWEVEICYLKRELQLRRDRKMAHDEYVRAQDAEFRAMQLEESRLPSADLDNSRFMFLD